MAHSALSPERINLLPSYESMDFASPSSLRRTPQVRLLLRFCAPGPARAGRAFYEAIALATFYEIINSAQSRQEFGPAGSPAGALSG